MTMREPLSGCPICGSLPGDGSANDGTFSRYCAGPGHYLATKSVASRDDAITAWNDIAGRWTGPTVGKPIKREPLPGWSQGFLEGMPETIGACLGFPRDSGKTQWFVELAYTHVSGESASPQLAAEDAARAMVADMAAALGGSVTWPTEGGE